MGLESNVNTIADLRPSNPTQSDPASQGDNHIRLIKSALSKTFPNISAPVTVSAKELNNLRRLSSSGSEINSAVKDTTKVRPVKFGGTGVSSLDDLKSTLFPNNSLSFLDNNSTSSKLNFLGLGGRGLTGTDKIGDANEAPLQSFTFLHYGSDNRPYGQGQHALSTFGGEGKTFQIAYRLDDSHDDAIFFRSNQGNGWSSWRKNPWIEEQVDRHTSLKAPSQNSVWDFVYENTPNNLASTRWRDVLSQRNQQTIYTNDERHPIEVAISYRHLSGSAVSSFVINGVTVAKGTHYQGSNHIHFTVYPGETYLMKEEVGYYLNIESWAERS